MGKKKNLFQKVGKQMKKGTKYIDKGVKKGIKKTVPKKARKTIAKGSKKYSNAYSKIDNKIYKGLGGKGSVLGETYRGVSYFNPLTTTKTLADVGSGKTNIVRAGLNEFSPIGDIQNAKNIVHRMKGSNKFV